MNTIRNNFSSLLLFLIITSCSLAPGQTMEPDSRWISPEKDFILLEGNSQKIYIEDINESLVRGLSKDREPYKIGPGDKLSITVWGLKDIFPMVTSGADETLRAVDTNGYIFFPYVGEVKASGRTQSELRKELTSRLSENFNDPQLDVTVVRFESQRVYILGEVTRPQKLSITETPLSLADALGQVNGLNPNTSSASEVFVIRQGLGNGMERIFRADMSSPASYLLAGHFVLAPQDIVYVNAKGITNWNRVITQFFPFSQFLNSLDNLSEN